MRWFKKDMSYADFNRKETQSGENANDTSDLLTSFNVRAEDIAEADKKLEETMSEIERLSIKSELNLSQLVETTQNFILSEIPVSAKSITLTKVLAEHIRLRLLSQQLVQHLQALTGEH